MTRWLVRFGYDGRPFAGWARQPGLRSVEGDLRRGLVRCGIAASDEAAGLEVASRTDRGVSARANALALNSRMSGPTLLRTLNAIGPEMFFTAAAEIPATFRLRAARSREYRYSLEPNEPRVEQWEGVAAPLLGRPIDVRSFSRGLPADRPAWRTLERIEIVVGPIRPQFRIVAPGFVWGMVRKLVQAFRDVSAGTLRSAHLEAAARGERRLFLALAAPQPLTLWSVEYDLDWEHRWSGATARQARYQAAQISEATARAATLGGLWDSGDRPLRASRPSNVVSEARRAASSSS
ncbi:MAG TPA: hypothetical protein VGV89_09790 [Thermoplasmata archaeon]|nr:hypothetical protein [Thermoplasmata archaeon]